MFVGVNGVIGIDTSVTASCGGFTIGGDIAPPAAITNGTFSTPIGGSNGITGVLAGSFSGNTSAAGTIDLTFPAILGCPNPLHLTWTTNHVDGGPIPVMTISATDPDASEVGVDDGTFTISRSGSLVSVSVQVSVTGTATPSTDYTSLFGATIPAGQSSATLTVHTVQDALVEGSETVILTLSDRAAYVVGSPSSATVTITDRPVPIVTISATDPDASESGFTTGTFTFTRTGSTALALTVSYTISGTASHGTDYSFIFSPITIPAGQASATLNVVPAHDSSVEAAETVILT